MECVRLEAVAVEFDHAGYVVCHNPLSYVLVNTAACVMRGDELEDVSAEVDTETDGIEEDVAEETRVVVVAVTIIV